jgi:hypothetical protein
MYLQLAMGFGLDLPLSAKLEKHYALPPDIFPFWRVVEPLMCTILTHHPHRDPDSPLELLRAFRRYMDSVPKIKNPRDRWQSMATRALPGPARNLPYWAHYDPSEPGQVPYVVWFLTHFSQFITRIGFGLLED